MDFKKINFKQLKYWGPAALYPFLLFLGGAIIATFQTELGDTSDPRLKTTSYLSSDLPEAYTDSLLGDKMDNSKDAFGKITDLSGVNSVENDNDSVNKKEDFESKYTKSEANAVEQQQDKYKEQLELRAMQNRVRENRGKSSSSSSSDFVSPVTDSDIERVQRKRRQRDWESINRDLNGSSYSSSGSSSSSSSHTYGGQNLSTGTSGINYDENGNPTYNEGQASVGGAGSTGSYGTSSRGSRNSDDSDEPQKVVKKGKETSDYFNSIGVGGKSSKLITAIIDENVKAVDGSRVRLRLLDDIQIGDQTVTKGTYIYVTMSGFSKQRVQGKIESIFFDEEIMKVDLALYDTDGLEGLYVPESSFRETTKDVASSAMQGGNILDQSSSSSSGIKSWANQFTQNASQKVMQALGTAAKKNRVRLKYGTRVYLVDKSQIKDKSKNN